MRFLRSPHVQAGLWAATIAVLMMLPADDLRFFEPWLPLSLDQWIDKVQHLIVFMVLVVFLTRSLSELKRIERPLLMAAILTLAFSFLLEAMQSLVPWRYWDVKDLVADALGVMMAVPIATRFVRTTSPSEVQR